MATSTPLERDTSRRACLSKWSSICVRALIDFLKERYFCRSFVVNTHVTFRLDARFLWRLRECACGCMRWISTRIFSRKSNREWIRSRYLTMGAVSGFCGRRNVAVGCSLSSNERCCTGWVNVTRSGDHQQGKLPVVLSSTNRYKLGKTGVEQGAGTSQRRSQDKAQRGATHRGRSGSFDAGAVLSPKSPVDVLRKTSFCLQALWNH